VHGRGTGEARRGPLEGGDAPAVHLVHEYVEGGLVELDDIDPVLLERFGLLVQKLGKGESHLHFVAIVAVGDRVGDGHRPGQGELELTPGMGARKLRFHFVHAPLEPQRRHHLRHHGFIAVRANPHLDLMFGIDPLYALKKAVHEVLTRLFAVADDVDAGILLLLDGEQRGIPLGGCERLALEAPGCPQLVGLRQPGRLRQAAGDCGLEHPSSRAGRRPFLAAIWPPL
jgi:hypothetical protein